MSGITASAVKELREQTGAGMMECKSALSETGGDLEKAKEVLRKKGVKSASKKADRATGEGLIATYMHHNNRVAVLLEVNCETDFMARTETFQEKCRDVAMHVAALNPQFVSRDEVPEDVQAKELSMIREESATALQGKPDQVVEKILDGKMGKWFSERCLMEQAFCKDDSKTVGQFVQEMIAEYGENIVIRRFARLEVGA